MIFDGPECGQGIALAETFQQAECIRVRDPVYAGHESSNDWSGSPTHQEGVVTTRCADEEQVQALVFIAGWMPDEDKSIQWAP